MLQGLRTLQQGNLIVAECGDSATHRIYINTINDEPETKEGIMKGENKELRFKRIAIKRVQRALDSLRSLSQLSNKRMYEWDEEQLKKIWSAVERELKMCKASFENAEPEDFNL